MDKVDRSKDTSTVDILNKINKLDKLVDGYNDIWEAIQDIQGKLAVLRTVVDDMVERGV